MKYFTMEYDSDDLDSEDECWNNCKNDCTCNEPTNIKQSNHSTQVEYTRSYCDVCNKNEIYTWDNVFMDFFTQKSDKYLSIDTTLTTQCCQSILCPNCIEVNLDNKKVIANHLLIEKVIYLERDDETFDESHFKVLNLTPFLPDELNKKWMTQYNWVIFKPIVDDSILKKYKKVDTKYNKYGSLDIKSGYCGKKVCVVCKCKKCGFECSAYNNMAS